MLCHPKNLFNIPRFLLGVFKNKTSLVCLRGPWWDFTCEFIGKAWCTLFIIFSNSLSSPNYLFTIHLFTLCTIFSLARICNLLPLVYAVCVFIALLAVLGFFVSVEIQKKTL